MWLIPGKTKVRLEIFKGVSLFDILIGALGVGFLILVFLSNFVNKIVIAAVVLVIFVVLLIRVDETPNYEIILCILRYLFCTKTFRKKEEGVKSNGKDIRELCAFTSIEKNLIRYGNNYVGAVLEIPAIEFRLFSKTRKANAIVSGVGGIIRNMNPSCGVNIVKLERPVHYEKYHESEVAKLEELRKSYEMGSLSEEELKARVDIIYGRLANDHFGVVIKGEIKDVEHIIELIKAMVESYTNYFDVNLTIGVYKVDDTNNTYY